MIKESTYNLAIETLIKSSVAEGFLASANGQDNYSRVWTRDGVICGLAALQSGNPKLIQTFRSTLQTIFSNQHPSGFMPSNVASTTGKVSYGGMVGRTDNPSWAIIGLITYLQKVNDTELESNFKESVYRAFRCMDTWEFNGRGLIYVPMSGNWADENQQHGYLLFDQLLRLWALELAGSHFKDEILLAKAIEIRNLISKNYHKKGLTENLYLTLLGRTQLPENHWIGGFNPGIVYTGFDLQANSLAILLKLGDSVIQELTIAYLDKKFNSEKNLFSSFEPISPGEKGWEELQENYAFRFRNYTNQFHNGGIWPVWNGFLAGILKSKNQALYAQMTSDLDRFCLISSENNPELRFNECFHGVSGEANGIWNCAWSAAGLILAYHGIEKN